MKLQGQIMLIVASFFMFSVQQSMGSEIGFSFGSSIRASELIDPASFHRVESYDYSSGTIVTIVDGDDPDATSFGHRAGAPYLDFIYVNALPRNGFELEHNVYGSFGARETVRKHAVGYSAHVNYVTPWYPEIAIWRMKPFIGAGAGYAYLFGTNKGFAPRLSLGSQGEFHFSVGGGAKIHVHKQWWLRLAVRDNITPWMTRIAQQDFGNLENSEQFLVETMGYYPVQQTAHHFSVVFSLVKTDILADEDY